MECTMLSVTSFLVMLVAVSCQTTDLEQKCINESNGICTVITDCRHALELMRNATNRDDSINKLRNMFCGFQDKYPKVCCPRDTGGLIVYEKSEEAATNRPKPKQTTTTTTTTTTTIRTSTLPELILRSTESLPDKPQHYTEPPQPTEPTLVPDPFPARSVCGQLGETDRIFGGMIAAIDEFPWLARIRYKSKDKSDTFGCSASLITDRYLISAAHCFISPTLKPVSVRLGEWNTETASDCNEGACADPPVEVEIESVIMYPKFNRRNVTLGDIALIRLKQPVTFTEFVLPVCLPTTEYIKMQDYVHESSYWTAGWGVTEFGEVSVVKRKVQVEAVPMDICRAAIQEIPESSAPNLICAGGRLGKDSCRGDSGGPLMRIVSENYRLNWFLYGITSFGSKNCGTEGVPGIYTRVATFMDWIREVVNT